MEPTIQRLIENISETHNACAPNKAIYGWGGYNAALELSQIPGHSAGRNTMALAESGVAVVDCERTSVVRHSPSLPLPVSLALVVPDAQKPKGVNAGC